MKILDACCGSRMFYFQKNHPAVTFMDIRQDKFEIHDKKVNVQPDIVGDFRNMPFDDEEFDLVIFDPPHLKRAGQNSIMRAQYGQLNKDTWKEDIFMGFDECMRVLKFGGTLIFKWSEVQIPIKEVLDILAEAAYVPLLGDQRGKTRWIVFVKAVSMNA